MMAVLSCDPKDRGVHGYIDIYHMNYDKGVISGYDQSELGLINHTTYLYIYIYKHTERQSARYTHTHTHNTCDKIISLCG